VLDLCLFKLNSRVFCKQSDEMFSDVFHFLHLLLITADMIEEAKNLDVDFL
jgi:hypothetical protein